MVGGTMAAMSSGTLYGTPLRSALAALLRLSPALAGDRSQVPILASTHREEDAGTPALTLFEALFGRDSLIAALLAADLKPQLLVAVVEALAACQGRALDASREEEPGRIPHEVRDERDPVARAITAGAGWGWPYYGSVDATPLFVTAVRRVTAAGAVRPALRESVRRAAGWLLTRLEGSDDLLASRPMRATDLENQVWKDSWDAYSYADGSVARPPIASVEVQGLAYDACLDAAELLGGAEAERLRSAAARLRARVLEHFWVDRGGWFALGVDWSGPGGAIRPLARRSSNMGHLLGSRLLDGPELAGRRESLAGQLFEDDLLCAAGIRTLGSGEARYGPGTYHNGSCWPWDCVWIALGLLRHGFREPACDLMARVLRAVAATGCFPEFVRGDSTPDETRVNDRVLDVWDPAGRMNRIEQPPQAIHATTAAAILRIKTLP
jgi:glycogen debranching enzyme